MDQAAALLREREARGLIAQYQIAGAVAAIFAVVVFFTTYDPVQRLIVTGAFAIPLVFSAFAWHLIRRRGFHAALGFGFCATALGLLAFIWWMAYRVAGPDEVAASFLPKAAHNAVPAMLIAVTGFTLRPVYPLVFGFAAAGLHGALIWAALADPRTELTTRNVDAVMGPKLDVADPITQMLVLLVTGVVVALVVQSARRTVREAIRLQMERGQLARYFSPNVADGIARANPDLLRPGGREQEVVVLFCDLAGFTRLAAGMRAGEALAFLSDYQARMVAAIFRHGGTLDKFIGDGIMATFGTPAPAADAADRAVAAARAMQQALAALNAERAARGEPAIAQRIGLHAGPALVGNVGTPERLEYTVIGDTVNIASRIEKACKALGESLLISEAVKARLSRPPALRPLPMITLEGQQEPIRLYTVESGQ